MAKNSGHAPSIQFYPNDFCRDLEEHPLEIAGAWIFIMAKLWYSDNQGRLTRTWVQWSKILRVDTPNTKRIIEYIMDEKIGDVTLSHSNVTIGCRRMIKDANLRRQVNLRQRKHRGKDTGNDGVTSPTPPSSSSSSSSSSFSTTDLQADSDISARTNKHLKHWLGLSKYKYKMGSKMPFIRADIRNECENYPDDEITKAIEAVGAGCYSWLRIREQLEKQAREIHRVEHQFDRAAATKEKLRKRREYLQKRVDDEKAGKAEGGRDES